MLRLPSHCAPGDISNSSPLSSLPSGFGSRESTVLLHPELWPGILQAWKLGVPGGQSILGMRRGSRVPEVAVRWGGWSQGCSCHGVPDSGCSGFGGAWVLGCWVLGCQVAGCVPRGCSCPRGCQIRGCQVWGCLVWGCPFPATHFQGRSSPRVPNLGVLGSQKGQVLEVLSPKVLSPGSPQHRPGLRASPGGRTALRPPPTRLLLRPQPTRGAPTEHGGVWGGKGGGQAVVFSARPQGQPNYPGLAQELISARCVSGDGGARGKG